MPGKGNYVGGRPKDESKLSKRPDQIRRRLRRASRNMGRETDVRMYLEATGKKQIEDWDLEELARGRPRNKNGGFAGRPPKWLTPLVEKEAKRRLLHHTLGELNSHVSSAIRTVVKLIESDEVDDKGKPIVDARTRLAACIFVIEHVTGKPKAVFEIEGTDATRQALAAAIVLDDGKPQGHLEDGVLEGEIVEEDEELQ